jgi:hypothetical protein
MTITLPEFKQRQGTQRGNEPTWRKAVVTAANTIKGLHLLDQEKHIAITVEKANELFGRQGYNLSALATPARRIDPVTKEVNKNWAALLDVKPIAQDKQARELKQYANLVLNLDLKKIRVWVTQGTNGDPVPESAIDGERRTILHAHMIKSLKGAAHITEEVCDGDIATLFSRVVQADQPEPKALLVDTLTRLAAHKKTENFSYIKWVTELKAIFDTLRAVQFDLSEDFQTGFLLALVRHDKRYEELVARVTEKQKGYEACLTLLRRRAETLADLKGGNAPAGVQLDSTKTEVHAVQQTPLGWVEGDAALATKIKGDVAERGVLKMKQPPTRTKTKRSNVSKNKLQLQRRLSHADSLQRVRARVATPAIFPIRNLGLPRGLIQRKLSRQHQRRRRLARKN